MKNLVPYRGEEGGWIVIDVFIRNLSPDISRARVIIPGGRDDSVCACVSSRHAFRMVKEVCVLI